MAFNIDEELKKLPDQPGVYIMKDNRGHIIYIGKAISLKKRVRQYFQSSKNKPPKVIAMVSNIEEFEYIITDNEVEALILESNLIKKHKPKYNVLLRDDKHYPYIKVTTNEKYPRVLKTRRIVKDGAKYFGPYVSNGAVNDTLDIIKNLYPIRTCNLNFDKGAKRQRPCLNYFIGRCLGPCHEEIDNNKYMEMINEILMFLNGKEDKLIEMMEEKMKEASKRLDFEGAAKFRDNIISLQHILEQQKIISTNMVDQDIIGMARGIDEVCVQVFFVRSGKIMGREHFMLTGTDDMARSHVLSSFIKQFYLGSAFVPKEILVEEEFEDMEVVEKWLSNKKGLKVHLKIPKRGEKSLLMEMVRKNALEALNQNSDRIKSKMDEGKKAVQELSSILEIEEELKRIEAFDISNLQGVESVGSMVVFEDGLPRNSDYRRFKIKSISGPNDYGSMEEVIYRRFNRALKEQNMINDNKLDVSRFSILPDLIMVDGGKGQIGVAQKVLKDLNLNIPICGLVKDDYHRTRGIIYNNEEINIQKNSSAFKLITRIQDEAHRFAINYHRSLRDKKAFKSVLDEIKGIGKIRRTALLKALGSIDNIRNASIDQLKAVEGMDIRSAEAVYNFFRRDM